MEPDDAAETWGEAQTFAELCELGARFLEGRVATFPGWGAATTDEETDEVAPLLARLNRAGFLTVASQRAPGPVVAADGRPERRRAFVAGFAAKPLAARLARLEAEGLWLRRHLAWQAGGEAFPTAERGGEAFLVAGHGAGPEELDLFAEWIPGPALEELAHTAFLWIVEPEWDRDDRLWAALDRALATPPEGPQRV